MLDPVHNRGIDACLTCHLEVAEFEVFTDLLRRGQQSANEGKGHGDLVVVYVVHKSGLSPSQSYKLLASKSLKNGFFIAKILAIFALNYGREMLFAGRF